MAKSDVKTDQVQSVVKKGARKVLIPANPFAPIVGMGQEVAASGRKLLKVGKFILRADNSAPELDYLKTIADDRSRFQAAMVHHGRTEADLPRIEKSSQQAVFLWATIVVALLAYAICSIRWEWEGTVASAFTMVPPWCFFVFACTRFARASFYFYQVKMRALVSLKTWFSDPGAWLSGPARAIGLALLVALALTPLAPHVAMADTSTPISATNVVSQLANATQSGDLSFQWMNRLFPGTVEFWFLSAGSTSTPSTSTDVLQALFQVLNSVLFALAAGMLSWHTVNGLVASAHTGKPLGDRWHTIWAPLRVVWGIGNLAPVKGYCMAQILVINLLLGGYSLANLEWQTYVDEITSPTGAMIVPPRIDATKSLVNNLVRAETCWQTL